MKNCEIKNFWSCTEQKLFFTGITTECTTLAWTFENYCGKTFKYKMTLPTKTVSTFQCSYDLKYARIRRKISNTEQIKFEKKKTKIMVKLRIFWRIFKQSFLPVLVPVSLSIPTFIFCHFFPRRSQKCKNQNVRVLNWHSCILYLKTEN